MKLCETYIFTYFFSVFVPSRHLTCLLNTKCCLFFPFILSLSFFNCLYFLHPVYKMCASPRLSGLSSVFLLKGSWFSALSVEFWSISHTFLLSGVRYPAFLKPLLLSHWAAMWITLSGNSQSCKCVYPFPDPVICVWNLTLWHFVDECVESICIWDNIIYSEYWFSSFLLVLLYIHPSPSLHSTNQFSQTQKAAAWEKWVLLEWYKWKQNSKTPSNLEILSTKI